MRLILLVGFLGMLEQQTTRFWQGALRSGLIDVAGLRKCWDAIPDSKREPEAVDRRMARKAIELGLLTLWQAQQILSGRTVGFQVDRYILLNLVGQGGMGRVYLARDTRLNRSVALKVLSPERMNNPRAIARFQREARVGAQLQHENLVRIYDEGEANGRCYLVMEYIEGSTIGQRIQEKGPYPSKEASRLVRQVALGLEHARQKGLIHRDVNPWNILVTPEGAAKLTDLGLAIDLADEADAVTRDGATVGTFDYISPEQARHSHSVDTRSDIYSLGCTLYHMMAGQVPFPAPSLPEKLYCHQVTEAESISSIVPGVPGELESVIRKMMRKDPNQRFATPLEVARALEPFIEMEEEGKSRPSGAGQTVLGGAPAAGWSPALPADSSRKNGAVGEAVGFDWTSIDVSERKPTDASDQARTVSSPADEGPSEARPLQKSDKKSLFGLLKTKPGYTEDPGTIAEPPVSGKAPHNDDFVWPTELPANPGAEQASVGLGSLVSLIEEPKVGSPASRASAAPSASVVLRTQTSSAALPAATVAEPPAPPATSQPSAAAKTQAKPAVQMQAVQTLLNAGKKHYLLIALATVGTCAVAAALLGLLQYWRSIDKPVTPGMNLKDIQGERTAAKGPIPPLAVIFSDGDQQQVANLSEAFEITGRGSVQIVLGPKSDLKHSLKAALTVSEEILTIRSAPGVNATLQVDLAAEPFIRVKPKGRLILEDLTIAVGYSGKSQKTPPVFEVTGEIIVRNCVFRALLQKPGSLLVEDEGSRLEFEDSWVQGFDHVIDVGLFGGSKTTLKRSLFVGDSAFGQKDDWLVHARFAPSLAGGKTRKLEIQESTFVGPSILLIEGFSLAEPLDLKISRSIFRANSLAEWKSPAKFDKSSIAWEGKSNLFDVDPGPWILGSPEAPADGAKFLESVGETGWRIKKLEKYKEAAGKSAESAAPSDFAPDGSGNERIGVDPESLGPHKRTNPLTSRP